MLTTGEFTSIEVVSLFPGKSHIRGLSRKSPAEMPLFSLLYARVHVYEREKKDTHAYHSDWGLREFTSAKEQFHVLPTTLRQQSNVVCDVERRL